MIYPLISTKNYALRLLICKYERQFWPQYDNITRFSVAKVEAISFFFSYIGQPDNGLNALKSDALLNDNGYNYSFYDRLGGLAKGYHKTHIINFQKLYDITGDIEWLKIKKVFEE